MCLLNVPTIGPAGDLVVVWYTGYPDCKRKAVMENCDQGKPQLKLQQGELCLLQELNPPNKNKRTHTNFGSLGFGEINFFTSSPPLRHYYYYIFALPLLYKFNKYNLKGSQMW